MADFKPHSLEECIFTRSKQILFADLATGRVTFSSPEADELFQSKSNDEDVVIMEPVTPASEAPTIDSLPALPANESGEVVPALRQKPPTKEQKSTAASLIGTELKSIFASVDQFEEKGVIQPTEICSKSDKEYSKWVYSCCHVDNAAGSKIASIYLLDVAEVKKEYTTLSRNPIPVDSVKKMVSPEIPDYILEVEYIVGDILSLRLDEQGKVTEMFPFSDKFLGISRTRLFNHPIMEFIHKSDQIVLTQALSECLLAGVCHFIIRWNPLSADKTKEETKSEWVQMKAIKSKGNSLILTVSGLLPKTVEAKPTVSQQAWAFISTTQNYNFGLTSPVTQSYGFGSLFGTGASEKSVNSSEKDPKM